MQVPVQALELPPPTPLAVVAGAVPDPVDQAVAADLTTLYQAVSPDSGVHRFSLLSPFPASPKQPPLQFSCQKLDRSVFRP